LTDALNSSFNNAGGVTLGVVVVPEPSTATLLALGLVGMAAGRRRAARAQ
jgi:hypothetical protein